MITYNLLQFNYEYYGILQTIIVLYNLYDSYLNEY